jgi:predicted RND superfamily exporter protein
VARRDDPRRATRQAVMLCSWTTTVGYGSLLLSGNAGIVSFGLTAILGEATCLVAALTLAPALLAILTRPPAPAATASGTQRPAGP